jgi:hypothetical protein
VSTPCDNLNMKTLSSKNIEKVIKSLKRKLTARDKKKYLGYNYVYKFLDKNLYSGKGRPKKSDYQTIVIKS